jgi:hypothetical protein
VNIDLQKKSRKIGNNGFERGFYSLHSVEIISIQHRDLACPTKEWKAIETRLENLCMDLDHREYRDITFSFRVRSKEC